MRQTVNSVRWLSWWWCDFISSSQPPCALGFIISVKVMNQLKLRRSTISPGSLSRWMVELVFRLRWLDSWNHTPSHWTRRGKGDHWGDEKGLVSCQGPWPELCPVKIDEQPPRNFWRPFLTAQIRGQWLHARMLAQKYYLHYDNFKVMCICAHCGPVSAPGL